MHIFKYLLDFPAFFLLHFPALLELQMTQLFRVFPTDGKTPENFISAKQRILDTTTTSIPNHPKFWIQLQRQYQTFIEELAVYGINISMRL